MVRPLLVCSVTFLLGAAFPAIAEVRPGDLTLTVTAETSGNAKPFAREMVLLRIRGVYRQQILLEEMLQPSLANFSWTQLGRDHWGRTKLPDGQNALVLDRVIAVFPHHAGDFTIEPFTHRLTVNDDGVRRMIDVRSETVSLPVAQWTNPAGGPDAADPWWLPAQDVSITDSWSPDPETLKVGESARRIVTIEAQGLVAEGLPPRPVMRTRGILTFAGPVRRETVITPAGPVARATYQWDVRPAIDDVIPLDAITIPWFDTNTRTMREAEIPARQIGGGLPDTEAGPPRPIMSWFKTICASGLAFCIGWLMLRSRPQREFFDRKTWTQLSDAARSENIVLFFNTLDKSLKGNNNKKVKIDFTEPVKKKISEIESHIYGLKKKSSVDLRSSLKILETLQSARATPTPDAAALASLDGLSDHAQQTDIRANR